MHSAITLVGDIILSSKKWSISSAVKKLGMNKNILNKTGPNYLLNNKQTVKMKQ